MREAVGKPDDLQLLHMEEQNIYDQIKAKHLDEVMDVPEEVDMDTEPYDYAKKNLAEYKKALVDLQKKIETLRSKIINAEIADRSIFTS